MHQYIMVLGRRLRRPLSERLTCGRFLFLSCARYTWATSRQVSQQRRNRGARPVQLPPIKVVYLHKTLEAYKTRVSFAEIPSL